MATHAKAGAGSTANKLTYFRRTVFPDAVTIRDKYPILYKAPWLLPLVWLYRPIYKLLFEPRDIKRHMQGLSAVNKAEVDEQRAFFNLVGLETR